jgi:type II secretory pathway pseudopilin PulG
VNGERSLLYVLLLAIVATAVAVTASVTYTNRAAKQSEARSAAQDEERDQRWCTLLGTLDDAYRVNPPVTDTGQKIARATASMRQQFGCPASRQPMGIPQPTYPPRPTPTG